MKTFADRLNAAMEQAGVSQGKLAAMIGVSQPAIQKMTAGKTQGSKKIIEIASALGVRAEWLSSGVGPMIKSPDSNNHSVSTIAPENEWGTIEVWDRNTPLNEDEVEVPFYKDIEMAAGAGRCVNTDYNGFKLRFSKATLRRMGVECANVFCCSAVGDSMEPLIPDGTTIAVDRGTRTIRDGKMYAIGQDGLYRVKVLYALPGRRVKVRSYNEGYSDEDVELDDLEIIGRVFWWSVLDY